jgi:hypothetical protein
MFEAQFLRSSPIGLLTAFILLLAGCGGAAPGISPTTAASASNLQGNWLLVGTLPFSSVSGSPQNLNFGFAGTFTVIGTRVEAALASNFACSGFGVSSPGPIVSGIIASNGSFTLQNAAFIPFTSMATITGSIPADGASTWSGHLTFSNGTGGACPVVAQSVDFQAIRIAELTGTYGGTTTLQSTSLMAPNKQNVTVTLTVQQGGAADGVGLSGALKIQGSSCLSSGTLLFGSGVIAPIVSIQLMTNDGSSAVTGGQILDTGGLHLSFGDALFNSSACGSILLSQTTLVRQ